MPEHPVPGLAKIATIAPPLDLEACSRPHPPAAQPHLRAPLPARPAPRRGGRGSGTSPTCRRWSCRGGSTSCEFDDLYTGPRNGFAGAMDYYRQSSAFRFVPRIPIPTLLLTARDDPFVAVAPFDLLRVPEHIRVRDRGARGARRVFGGGRGGRGAVGGEVCGGVVAGVTGSHGRKSVGGVPPRGTHPRTGGCGPGLLREGTALEGRWLGGFFL